MIGDYLVVALVFGIAGSFAAIIHHFWLRDAFKEEGQQTVPAKNEGTGGISTPGPSAQRARADCHKHTFWPVLIIEIEKKKL